MSEHSRFAFAIAIAAWITLWTRLPMANALEPDADLGRVRAPDFDGATGWLNTEKPISIKQLRGQVVVIDFWTYCCINCMHVFPDLKWLEKKYHDRPVVILGVHSGKFDQEKDEQNIREAVLRHNISHPVAVDNDYNIWNAYAVNAWPTLIVIDSSGYVVGHVSGEGHRDQLDKAIATLLEQGKKAGTLGQPMHFRSERDNFKSGELEFPGKLLADEANGRLLISDTNHHRVLVASLDGKIAESIGSGSAGLKDGSFTEAEFDQPQGLALSADGKTLFVADTENHALRGIDLEAKRVLTLAGTGVQSHDFHAAGLGVSTPLSSPWDLARVNDTLYIAMAGTHQVWAYDLRTRQVGVYAGNGREAAVAGPAARASFAQPSGLATDGKTLYVASSEASCVQAVDLSDGSVRVLAGSGQLFGFGSTDGPGGAARFQHPLGLTLSADGSSLFVADTFNNLIRRIDLKTREVRTVAGTGKPEPGTDRAIGFYEPGGLSLAGHALWVADTNRHRIVKLDLDHELAAQVVEIRR